VHLLVNRLRLFRQYVFIAATSVFHSTIGYEKVPNRIRRLCALFFSLPNADIAMS
jgi:hypothetical protein